MKYAVYWQPPHDIEVAFFKTEAEAKAKVQELIAANQDTWDEGYKPDWDITLLKVIGEVHEIPLDGGLRLEPVA